jgi:hypothetical protein
MINENQKKIAYAEGNPYEDFDLRVQFNYGFRTATDRIDSLLQKEYA